MQSEIITLASAVTHAAATTVSGTGVAFRKAWKEAMVFLNVTAAATTSGDTLDVLIDTSPDGGSTWFNIGHFTQVLGDGGTKKFLMSLGPAVPGATAVLLSSSDAAAGATRQIGIGDRLRYRSTVASGSAPSFTFTIKALLK